MIDDHPKNLLQFQGQKFLFTEPHNVLTDNKDFFRVNNWLEILNIL